jgi:Polyketide cyclase / dehydrase and lipid transport
MTMIIVFVVLVLLAAILGFATMKPDTLRVQRDARINASSQSLFALVNDFHRWGSWAPQDRMDPKMKRSYSGAASGVGAVSEWDSSGQAGKGRMEITAALPPSKITVRVDFVKPFEAHNINEFTFDPEGDNTKVTWAMQGSNIYLTKIMSVFINMDRMLGTHFETGLRNLKTIAEAQTKATQHSQ